jgi:hypothetical protein
VGELISGNVQVEKDDKYGQTKVRRIVSLNQEEQLTQSKAKSLAAQYMKQHSKCLILAGLQPLPLAAGSPCCSSGSRISHG